MTRVVLLCRIVLMVTLLKSTNSVFSSFQDLRFKLLNDGTSNLTTLPRPDNGGPLKVYVRVSITDVKTVVEGDDRMNAVIHLQSIWNDTRLSFLCPCLGQNGTLPRDLHKRIWLPDVYFEPEWIDEDSIRMVRLFTNGGIVENRRLKVTLPCSTIYNAVTHRAMKCSTLFTSYEYNTNELDLIWYDKNPVVLNVGKFLVKEVSDVSRHEHGVCDWVTVNEYRASCLDLHLYTKHVFNAILLRVYVPSFMAVLIAYSSFWIHRDEVSARIKLGTLVVWTVMTEYTAIEFSFPNYLDHVAGNVWMLGCLSFTWLSFFLYVLIHVVRRREKTRLRQVTEKKNRKAIEEKRTGERAFSITSEHPEGQLGHGLKGYSVWDHREKRGCQLDCMTSSWRLERFCRVVFGLAIVVALSCYCAYFGTIY